MNTHLSGNVLYTYSPTIVVVKIDIDFSIVAHYSQVCSCAENIFPKVRNN